MSSIRDIFRIDPCKVAIGRCDDEDGWYVYRLEGVDTVVETVV